MPFNFNENYYTQEHKDDHESLLLLNIDNSILSNKRITFILNKLKNNPSVNYSNYHQLITSYSNEFSTENIEGELLVMDVIFK